ncbi:von Willebrand factor, type A [Mycena vulgaris]|nr:von Willebrand factor, type A [Mycena vulgaris]
MAEKPSMFSSTHSKSSSYLPLDSTSRSTDGGDDLPPSYDSLLPPATPRRSKSSKYKSSSWLKKPMRKETFEDALELLRKYDTVILLDDSGSMTLPGSKKGLTRWYEAGEALEALAETAQQYDTDGIDIYFLNNKKEGLNIKVRNPLAYNYRFNELQSSSEVRDLFSKVKPFGATPTGERLDQILKPRLVELEEARIERDGTPKNRTTGETIKRVNFIVITDGEATDNPKYPLGIQFVQIGNDSRATRALKELDNDLHKTGNIRDIVDTTPYSKLNPVTADGLIKVLLGGINRRVDEQSK